VVVQPDTNFDIVEELENQSAATDPDKAIQVVRLKRRPPTRPFDELDAGDPDVVERNGVGSPLEPGIVGPRVRFGLIGGEGSLKAFSQQPASLRGNREGVVRRRMS
jgi:hypothetical protein